MSDQAVNPPAKSSMMPMVAVAIFIGLIAIAETVIFFAMVPSADDVAALAEARLMEKLEKSMEKDGDEKIPDADSIKEFALGEYGVRFTPPGSDRNYVVEFRLFGTVKAKDEKRLETLYAERQNRFRDRMQLEVRNATMDELTENQLGLIRRRILATTNEILEEPIVLGVGFADYQLMEE